MPKVWNRRSKDVPKDAIYVGRPTPFGNPYVIGKDGTREECVERYKQDALSERDFIALVRKELKGKDLVCWCAPKACHADVLLELANR